jgi:hypothetical protein
MVKEKEYYTAKEMGAILGISYKTVLNKLSLLGMDKHKTMGSLRHGLYSHSQLLRLSWKRDHDKVEHKYYPIYVETTYHIYESKMNTL